MKEYFKTLPEMIQHVLDTCQNPTAFNYKVNNVWKHMSTEYFMNQIHKISLGLRSLGLQKGECVGILTNPSPFWLIADFAIMIAGGISVPFFTNDSQENFKFKIRDSGMKFLFIFDDESGSCRDTFIKLIQPNADYFKNIITRKILLPGKNSIDYEKLMVKGDELSKKNPDLFTQLHKEIHEEDLVTIIYTSGSTGTPKGVELTNKNFISQVTAVCSRYPLKPIEDKILSCLPLAHSFERMVMYYYISSGVSVYFADDIKNVGVLLREVKPAIMTVVPRLLEKVYAKMTAKIDAGSHLKRKIGRWAIRLASETAGEDDNRKRPNFLADFMVYSKMRKAFGGNLRYLIVGGAAMPVDLCHFFVNIGIPLYQGYGLTEASPVLTVNYPGHNKVGAVGPAIPGVDLKLTSKGEILAKGPNIMRGYHNKAEETASMIDTEGWLHTGDLGEIDDEGYLTITGRIKELCKTSTGEYVCPVPIEQALCRHHLVDMASIVAEGKKFVSCLLFVDHEHIREFMKQKGHTDMSVEDFLESDYVKERMSALLESINSRLNHWEQIKDYRFVSEPVSTETGELTPTMKLRRHVIDQKYKDLIDGIYNEDSTENNKT